jgi:glycosyltransferase involved in cell wall biosynthesis
LFERQRVALTPGHGYGILDEERFMQTAPLVSVVVHTYNHRLYIDQCIESILAQRRDFPIEIVISDDCSPDGTGKTIDEYQARHPELFVRVDPERNVGAAANFTRVWTPCRGKYLAMLDGDDWWNSPDKLATQVAFMEANPEYTFSAHTVRVVQMPDCREIKTQPLLQYRRPRSTVQDLIAGGSFNACSLMFKRGIVTDIPDWMYKLSLGDWPLQILHALHGPVGFIDQPLSTYRLHQGGVWTNCEKSQQIQRKLHALSVMRENLPPTFRGDFSKSICQHECYLILQYDQDQFGLARQALTRVLHLDPKPTAELKKLLHWHFRKLSEQHGLLSQERYLWLQLAYRAYPAGFHPFRLMGSLAKRTWRRMWDGNTRVPS